MTEPRKQDRKSVWRVGSRVARTERDMERVLQELLDGGVSWEDIKIVALTPTLLVAFYRQYRGKNES